MKNCWSCGNSVDETMKFCSKCGVQLISKTCSFCNQINDPKAIFCSNCGRKFENAKNKQSKLAVSNFYGVLTKLFKYLFLILIVVGISSIIYFSFQYLPSKNNFSVQQENELKIKYKIGDVVEFGNYYQNDLTQKTPIQWRILDIQNGNALLLSELLLDAYPYQDHDFLELSWKKSSIRQWLNSKFMNEAFNELEKSNIILNSQDKLFFLSLDEVHKYLSETQLFAPVTLYAKKHKAHFSSAGYGAWWLRTPGRGGFITNTIMGVHSDGKILTTGYIVGGIDISIRPALWINLKNVNFESNKVSQKQIENETQTTIKDAKNNIKELITTKVINKPEKEIIDLRKGKYASDDYYATIEKYSYDKNNFDDAISVLSKLSENDDTGVPEYLIARLYHNATKDKKNIEKAMYYYDMSSKKGNGLAKFRLGLLYKTNKRDVDAYSYIEDSVNLKVPVAINYLGYMYEIGQIVNQDYNQAKTLYEQARELGFYPSSYALANLYFKGLGVNRNTQQACHYLKEAIDNNVNKASDLYYKNCEELENKTTKNDYKEELKKEHKKEYKKEYKIGDVIEFGNYYQNDLTKKTPIRWRILDIKNNKALLVSELLLDVQPYNKEYKNITWENSSIRRWLNNEFINEAFSKSEQNKINLTYLHNNDNKSYGTKGGNDTQDKIFLLSINEVERYLTNRNQRMVKLTKYAKEHDASSDYVNGTWWLRSPGSSQSYAAIINFSSVGIDGSGVAAKYNSIRPALYLDL